LTKNNSEEILEDYLASLEPWLQRLLRWAPPQPGDLEAWATADRQKEAVAIAQYEELLLRVPAKRREYLKRQIAEFKKALPKGRRGAPRKDREAEEAIRLHDGGAFWSDIGRLQKKTRDAARKLAKSRNRQDPGKK